MVIICSSLFWGFGFMEEVFLEVVIRRVVVILGIK